MSKVSSSSSSNSNTSVMFLWILPVVMMVFVVTGVNAANMAGPAIVPSKCDKTIMASSSSSTTSDTTATWFGIPTQRRYLTHHHHHHPTKSSSSCLVLEALRGGGSSETIRTPSSVADLDALLIQAGNEQQLVVIDFTASWCGPCQTIAPKVRVFVSHLDDILILYVCVCHFVMHHPKKTDQTNLLLYTPLFLISIVSRNVGSYDQCHVC